MLMASALMNHWVSGGSGHRGYLSNSSVGCFKVLARNYSVIKGKQFLPRERVASTGWQITRAVQKNSSNAIHLHIKNKWWERDMKANMKNIKSQEDLDEQLLMAGDNLTVVQFFSPRCPACKALHPKVRQYAGIHPELQFLLINCDEHREIGQSHNIHVLPMFRFYRGAEGRICSFSCTIATIHKFKAALKRHGVQTVNPTAEKGLAKFDPERVDSFTDVPNKIQTENLTEEKGLAEIGPESIDSSTDVPNKIQTENLTEEKGLAKLDPESIDSSTDVPNKIDASQNMDEDVGPITLSNE